MEMPRLWLFPSLALRGKLHSRRMNVGLGERQIESPKATWDQRERGGKKEILGLNFEVLHYLEVGKK